MWQALQAGFDWVMARPALYAPGFGVVISLLFTQLIKYLYPKRWREIQRRSAIIATAMLLAGGATLVLHFSVVGAVEALVVALLAPMIYHYGVKLLALKWPQVREWLSAD